MTTKEQIYSAVVDLYVAQNAFNKGQTSTVEFGYIRGKLLISAVTAIAEYFGCTLKPMYAIDANGELSIVAVEPTTYGAEFAEWLTKFEPRTGIIGTKAVMLPESSWCRMNHFKVEKLVQACGIEICGLPPFSEWTPA